MELELAFNIGLSVILLFVNFLMSYHICREARKERAKRRSEDDKLAELKAEIEKQKQRIAEEEEAQIKATILEKVKRQKMLREEWKKICANNQALLEARKKKFEIYAAEAGDKMKKNFSPE